MQIAMTHTRHIIISLRTVLVFYPFNTEDIIKRKCDFTVVDAFTS